MTKIEVYPEYGFLTLLDDFGNRAFEYHDKTFVNRKVLLDREDMKDLPEQMHRRAIEEGHLLNLEGNYTARGAEGWIYREIL